ncbi:RidA family protein [Fontivita pretiosa]|jgi:enamine deaminase RidA (YjgF/YER057c/UK114 family)|uniref:RidA family protein n=1 Tax=Fontivita pretiosa TaxID=2989684 RepID=UPI003D1833B2
MDLREKLRSLGISLPAVSGPFGAYLPAKRVADLIYVAGQLPVKEGKLLASGQVPSRCDIERAKLGARQCVINALAAVAALPGGMEQLAGVVRVGVYVSSDPDFTQQPQIANAASELLLELFGDPGRHVRAAIGVNTLPLDASVEVELVFLAK